MHEDGDRTGAVSALNTSVRHHFRDVASFMRVGVVTIADGEVGTQVIIRIACIAGRATAREY